MTRMNEVAILAAAYAASNARDIDAVTAFMHPNVEWPNGMEGEHHSRRVYGNVATSRRWSPI
jgi:ketosteroid isomerase-like protein